MSPDPVSPGPGQVAIPGVFHWLDTPLEPGATLIEASAGTGKTFTLAAIYVRLILEAPPEQPLDVRNILVATFGKAAAAELRERLRQGLHSAHETLLEAAREGALPENLRETPAGRAFTRMEDPAQELPPLIGRLELALREFDEASVHTLHAFFQKVLKQNPFESGLLFSTEMEPDSDPLIQELAEDYWRQKVHKLHPVLLGALGKPTLKQLVSSARTLANHGDIEIQPAHERGALERLERQTLEALARLRVALEDEFEELMKGIGPGARHIGAFKTPYGHRDFPARAAESNGLRLRNLRDALQGDELLMAAGWEPLSFFDPAEMLTQLAKKQPAADNAARWIAGLRTFAEIARTLELCRSWAATFSLEYLHSAAATLARKSTERDVHTFNSLELRLGQVLADPERGPELCRRVQQDYQVCLLDEFQDTNRTQARIFFELFRERALYMIGDPKQAIYEFRGADLHAYIWAAAQAHQRYTLRYNYRSSAALVRAVQRVAGARVPPFVLAQITLPEVEAAGQHNKAHDNPLTWPEGVTPLAPVQLVYFRKDYAANPRDPSRAASPNTMLPRMVPWVVGEIRRLLAAGGRLGNRELEPSDIAVLVNENKTGRRIQEELRGAGLAASLTSSGSVWQSEVAEDWQRVLLAIARTEDERLLRGALVTRLVGLTGDDLARLREAEEEWEGLLLRFRGYHETWSAYGIGVLHQRFLQGEHIRERQLRHGDGERMLVDLQHMVELMAERAREQELGMEGTLAFLDQQMNAPARGSTAPDLEQQRRDREGKAVQIVTVHRSKGLEYPITFLVEGWRARPPSQLVFHHPETGRMTWHYEGAPDLTDTDDDDADAPPWKGPSPQPAPSNAETVFARQQAGESGLSSALRQFYVGLTRAQHLTYILHAHAVPWGSKANPEQTATPPLAYLLHNGPIQAEAAGASWARQDDDQLIADLEQLAASGPELFSLRLREADAPESEPTPAVPRPVPAPAEDVGPLEERRFLGWIPRNWRILSFTAIKNGRALAETEHAPAADEAEDEPDAPSPDSGEAPELETPLLPVAPAPSADLAPEGSAFSIHTLPGGERTGTMLHQVIEQLDFQNPANLRELVEQAFRPYASLMPFVQVAAENVRAVLTAEYHFTGRSGEPLILAQVPAEKRVAEMQFWLPLGRFSPTRMAEILQRHAVLTPEKPYLATLAERIVVQGRQVLEGFLNGYLDLVCEWGGRYYIVDWKSNRLGPDDSAYTSEAIREAMERDLYTLQYHLYTVALHRLLRQRLPGYAYARHFGGALYVFMRGAGAPGGGAFTDVPTPALVADLDAMFGP